MWTIALIFGIGMLSALGNKSIILLIEPVMAALFPEEAAARAAAEAQVEETSEPGGFFGALAGLGDRFDAWREENYGDWLGQITPESTADERFSYVIGIVILFAVISVFTAAAMYAFTMLGRYVSLKMIIGLRMRIARHLMRQSVGYHGRQKFGDLLSRISTDVQTTLVVLNNVLKELIEQPTLALVSVALAFLIAPLPTLALFVTLPLLAIPISILTRKIRKRSKKSLTALGASVQVLSQMFQGVRTVKAFRAEEREMQRFEDVNESYLRSSMKMVRAIATTHGMTLLLSHLGMALLLLGVGWFTIRQDLFKSYDELMMLMLLIATMYTSVKKTTRVWARVQESVGAAQRLQELLDAPTDIHERDDAVPVSGLGGGVRFEEVSFAYPDASAQAVTNLTFELVPGETLALVGPSGAGKSTVIDLIARFIDPAAGRVTVNGRDLRDVTLDSWTDHFAMVGQHPFLFHASIEENIRYGKPDATRDEIVAAARAANIHDFIEGLPEGYETDVAEAGSRLSGGQRQRITIARAMLKNAPLLLLDEATSALDTESEKVVQEALDNAMRDHTVVVIAHRLSTIRNADRIAVLDGGRLVEIGTHEELLGAGGVYSRLHAAQFATEREAAVK